MACSDTPADPCSDSFSALVGLGMSLQQLLAVRQTLIQQMLTQVGKPTTISENGRTIIIGTATEAINSLDKLIEIEMKSMELAARLAGPFCIGSRAATRGW